MLNLMLLRHAKSNPAEGEMTDMARPLTGRGKRAASAVGKYMAANGLAPDLVLCSPAVRARETWKRVAKEFRVSPTVVFERGIYDLGDGDNILNALRRHAGDAKSVLLVGHNPSIESLAQRLVNKGDRKIRDRLKTKYPTGALSVIALNCRTWTSVDEGTGALARFVRPADIMDGVDVS